MPNSIYTAVSGLRVSQQDLDVVGNNIANLNTPGFKDQRTNFADLLYQTLSPGSGGSSSFSGTNPEQVGLGVAVKSIDSNFQQGGLQATGNPFDLAIQGNGFFVVNNGFQNLYTRAGSFAVDGQNFLVDPGTGFRVQRFGTLGEGSATSPAFQTTGSNDIQIPFGTAVPGQATTAVTFQGNLNANAVGPLAQVLTTGTPFKAGGQPANANTLLNALDDHSAAPYQGTDAIRLQGTTTSGAAVNVTISVGPTTTLGNLVAAINANFPGSTASLDASGNLVITANATGPSSLAVNISDVAGNVGTMAWSNHQFAVTTTGKNGDTVNSAIQVFDSQGTAHTLSLTFQKTAANTWNLTGSIPASAGTITAGAVQTITFNNDGSLRLVTGGAQMTFQFTGISTPQTISLNFGTPNRFNGLTQFGSPASAAAVSQDGSAAGFLTSVSVGKDGVVTGVFSNGKNLPLAQMAIANFSNPAGLNREGNNDFSQGAQSGVPQIGAGLSGGRGTVLQGTLEQSNVDIATEFTKLIIAQRSFEANARAVTVTDQVLQSLTQIIQ
jgi:flagellar hook protein FlgE